MSNAITINLTQPSSPVTVNVSERGQAGVAGADGPNNITASTTTDLTGVLTGDGASVGVTLTSTGGNGAADSGKIALFGVTGGLTAERITVSSSAVAQSALTATASTDLTYAARFIGTGSTTLMEIKGDGSCTVSATLAANLLTAIGALDPSNNLSDLDNASTARTNLSLGSGDSPTFAGITADALLATSGGGVGIGFNAFNSSNVALRPSGLNLDVVRGDASSYASLRAQDITVSGTLTVSNSPMVSRSNVASTVGEQNAFTLVATTNGTAAATFGPRLLFKAESASGAERDAAGIAAVWTDANDATRTADMVFSVVASGTQTEKMRLNSTGDLVVSRTVKTTATTFASLPAAATAGAGARSFITDCNTTTFLATAAGGGANAVPVVSDGTNWLVG